MKIIFRVDSSTCIGSGHIRRCTILAESLRAHGAHVSFICRTFHGHLCDDLEHKGFLVYRLQANNQPGRNSVSSNYQGLGDLNIEQDAIESSEIIDRFGVFDWLIVDHYALTLNWQRTVSQSGIRILVIDDLALHKHQCDVLVNHAYLPRLHEQYSGLVPSSTRLLLGPDFFLLNPAYNLAREKQRSNTRATPRIMVFFGGADATNETTKAIKAISTLRTKHIKSDIIVTHQNPHKNSIRHLVEETKNCKLYEDLPHLAGLMSKATVSLGAAGGTAYERLFMGLPSIVVTTAANQTAAAQHLHQSNLILLLGDTSSNRPQILTNTLETWLSSTSHNFLVSPEVMMRLVDGKGLSRIERVLKGD